MEQSDLDKFILSNKNKKTNSSETKPNLEKGLNKYTYNSIANELNNTKEEYFTTEDLSEKLGIAKSYSKEIPWLYEQTRRTGENHRVWKDWKAIV